MADFRKMIPFILHFAAGVSVRELEKGEDAAFEAARRKGWSDDPDDPGGPTMIDVTLKTFRAHRRAKGMLLPNADDLKAISRKEWEEILKSRFWDLCSADGIASAGLAHLVVDWVWSSGPGVLRTVQRLAGTAPDGVVGPQTLAALNCGGAQLFGAIKREREAYCRRCRGASKYLHGWLRRLDSILPDGSFRLKC